MLESIVNLNLDASLCFLLLRTVSGNYPLGFCEVGSDGLWIREMSDLIEIRVLESTNLDREVIKRSSFNRVDSEFIVRVNGRETSGNLM